MYLEWTVFECLAVVLSDIAHICSFLDRHIVVAVFYDLLTKANGAILRVLTRTRHIGLKLTWVEHVLEECWS